MFDITAIGEALIDLTQTGLSASGVQRAITAVADSISQYLENELVMNGIFMQKNR